LSRFAIWNSRNQEERGGWNFSVFAPGGFIPPEREVGVRDTLEREKN